MKYRPFGPLCINFLCLSAFSASSAFAATNFQTPSTPVARPDELLSVDMQRSAVVEKILKGWSADIPLAQIDDLKNKLSALRADQLLSASLSGSFDGVLEVLNAQRPIPMQLPAIGTGSSYYAAQTELKTNSAMFAPGTDIADRSKAAGEIDKDMVYTPVTPCRLFDTRTGQNSALGTLGGVMSNQTTRTLVAGGRCGIPSAGVKSIFVTFHAYTFNPSVLGVITFQKTGAAPTGLSATWTGGVWATGTTITGTLDNGSFDVFVGNGSPMTADMIVDVVGYFQGPNRNGDGLRVIATAPGAPIVINGSSANSATGTSATVSGGGLASTCSDRYSGASRTCGNTVNGSYSAIGGGLTNQVGLAAGGAEYATIAGGWDNTVTTSGGAVGGGVENIVNAANSVIAGGFSNYAGGNASTVGGGSGNIASGTASVVTGGRGNTASGDDSFAAGRRAKATKAGQYVWADSNDFDFDPTAQLSFGGAANTFHARATGGVRFVTGINTTGAITTGCFIGPTGTGWTCTSDRNLKSQIKSISPRNVLEKLIAMPITTWSMVGTNVRQMGPMAQDFYQSFGLGATDQGINSVDAQGVAFAAIQGLHQKLADRDAKIAILERELAAIKRKLGL